MRLICFVIMFFNYAYFAHASPWWEKNIKLYNYDKKSYGMKHSKTMIYFDCMLLNDGSHKILAGEDWHRKIKTLGYNIEKSAYNIISVSNLKISDPNIVDGWYDATCYGEVMTQ